MPNLQNNIIINPRHACAARVTVVAVSVCLSVCPLSHISPLGLLFILKTLLHTQRATKVFSVKLRSSRATALLALYGYRAVGNFLSAEYARALLKCHVDRGAEFGQLGASDVHNVKLRFIRDCHQLSLRFCSSFSVLVSCMF